MRLVDEAQWLSWLERRPVTAEVAGSSPAWVVYYFSYAEMGSLRMCAFVGKRRHDEAVRLTELARLERSVVNVDEGS